MFEIDLTLIIHHLNIDPNYFPIKQKWKVFIPKRYEAIKIKVDKLFKVGFIRSVD